MRKERNSTSSQDFAATSGNGAAWQNTRRVNPQYTADGQLRISGPVWTIGALATPDGEFRLLVVNRTRNILLALRTVSILGLLILSLGSVAVGQQNSSSRLEQGSTTPDAVFSVSGVVLDPTDAAITGARVTLRGRSLKNERSTTTDSEGHFQFAGATPGSYEVEVQQEGFKILRSSVKVGHHSSAPLRIVLPLAELHEEVTAKNSQDQLSRDATENADIIRLDRQELDSLPMVFSPRKEPNRDHHQKWIFRFPWLSGRIIPRLQARRAKCFRRDPAA